MVGVPRRSNACHTCKKRKKRCDKQQPNCGQCKDARILCEGYGRSLIFINSGQKHAQTQKGCFTPKRYSPTPLVDSQGQHRDTGPPARLEKPASLLKRCLEISAWESKYFEIYWTSLLPNGQAFSPRAAQYSTAGWSGVVQDLCHQDSLVRQALLANALALLGHHSGQHSIVVEAWRAYGRSLRMLSQSLSRIGQDNHENIFAATTLLKQYQLLECTKDHNESSPAVKWLMHAPGEQAIIAAKPPSYYTQGYAHRLFVDSRLNLLYFDLQNRKRSIFSSPAWKSDPWEMCTKDPKDELLDILVEIPGLQEDFDSFLACSPNQEEKYRCLLHQLKAKCWLYDEQLERWATTSGALTLTLVESVISNKVNQNKNLSSLDLAMAHLGMVYWSICILLYHPLWTLAGITREKLPERVNPRNYCRKIALLMPCLFAPEVGDFSINMAGFPAIVALRFLARSDPAQQPSEEREMLLRSLNKGRGRHLRSFLRAWPRYIGPSERVGHQDKEQGFRLQGQRELVVPGNT